MSDETDRETTSQSKSSKNLSSMETTRAQAYHDLICGYKQRRGARRADVLRGYSEALHPLEASRDGGLHGGMCGDKGRRNNEADLFESDEDTNRSIESSRPSSNNRRRRNPTDHFDADGEAVHPTKARPANQDELRALRRGHGSKIAAILNRPFAEVATPVEETPTQDPLATGPARRLQEARNELLAALDGRHAAKAAFAQEEWTRTASEVAAEHDQLIEFDRLNKDKTPAEKDSWFAQTNERAGISVSGVAPKSPAYSPLRERRKITPLPTIGGTSCKGRGIPAKVSGDSSFKKAGKITTPQTIEETSGMERRTRKLVPVYCTLRKPGMVTIPQTIENANCKKKGKTIGRRLKVFLCSG